MHPLDSRGSGCLAGLLLLILAVAIVMVSAYLIGGEP